MDEKNRIILLKAAVYDILVQIEALQLRLRQLNQAIQEESSKSESKEEKKGD